MICHSHAVCVYISPIQIRQIIYGKKRKRGTDIGNCIPIERIDHNPFIIQIWQEQVASAQDDVIYLLQTVLLRYDKTCFIIKYKTTLFLPLMLSPFFHSSYNRYTQGQIEYEMPLQVLTPDPKKRFMAVSEPIADKEYLHLMTKRR